MSNIARILILLILTTTLSQLEARHKKKHSKSSRSYAQKSILYETAETYAIVSLLKVYEAYDESRPIQMLRLGRANDGGYVVPECALQKADVIMGYGVADDISFEDTVSAKYGKPSYGFDCTSFVRPSCEKCHFVPSCIIGEDREGLYPNFATFNQHLDLIDAQKKKIFIKMDIEGNEYGTLPDILSHDCDITGIVLEIHFEEIGQVLPALQLMQRLDQEFLLLHVHGNNGCKNCFVTTNALGTIPRVLELTYINRSLVQRHEILANQTHPNSLDMANCPHLPDFTFTILH